MTTEPGQPPHARGLRFEVLLAVLALLVLTLMIGRFASSLPHEPRWVVVNTSGDPVEGLVLIGPGGPYELGRMEHRGGQVIRLDPRPADRYRLVRGEFTRKEFSGSELLTLRDVARAARRDVGIILDEDGIRLRVW